MSLMSLVDISWKGMPIGARSLETDCVDNHYPLSDYQVLSILASLRPLLNNGPQPAITARSAVDPTSRVCWHSPRGQGAATWITSTTACMNSSIAAYTIETINHQGSSVYLISTSPPWNPQKHYGNAPSNDPNVQLQTPPMPQTPSRLGIPDHMRK